MSLKSCRIVGQAGLSLLLIALWVLCPAIAAASATGEGTPTTFSGQATVVRSAVLGITTTVSDTGPLPSSGGALNASLLTVNVPNLLTADVAHATMIGQGNASSSEASVADLNLAVGGQAISASFLMARAMAVCTGSSPSVSGSSEILGLVINGQAITVTGEPNQTVQLPLGAGSVIINEQSSAVSGKTGTITVNALHVIVTGTADVVISSASADVTCGSTEVVCGADFVTGGGFITTPSGAKGNFGVAGGIKNGAFWGHLEYIDHGPNGPKVHGIGVTNYVVVSATQRNIEGTATVNGQSGFTYSVDVTDNGEPGTNDSFTIRLSNGYVAGGTLAGGNIKIHEPCGEE